MHTIMYQKIPARGWSAQEIADHFGLAVRTVWYEIKRGNLKAYKVASRVLIYQDDLDAWLQAKPYIATPKVQGRGRKANLQAALSMTA